MTDPTTKSAEPDRTRLPDAVAEMLVLRLSDRDFGVDVGRVLEVVRVPSVTRLPTPGPAICGVASLRGDVIPVLDLGIRLLDRPTTHAGRLVVVEDERTGGPVGLLVDDVVGLAPIRDEVDEPAPELIESMPAGWIRAILSPSSDRLVTLLELSPVLALRGSPGGEEE